MGQAKRRGSYAERKKLALEEREIKLAARLEIQRRKPSPKHTSLMAHLAMAGILQSSIKY